jgi:hypothetical protein
MRTGQSRQAGRCTLAVLASSFALGSLCGCASVHVSGDPGQGGMLKRTTEVIAATPVGVSSDAQGGSLSNVWQDSSGMWHWTRRDHRGETFKCEGRQLGVPSQCEKI